MEKSCRNVHQKLNNPKQPLHAINSFKNKIFLKRIIKKPLKSYFIFSFEPSLFYWTKSSKPNGVWNWWPVALQVEWCHIGWRNIKICIYWVSWMKWKHGKCWKLSIFISKLWIFVSYMGRVKTFSMFYSSFLF